MKRQMLFPGDFPDYELIDSGKGKKLERFGEYTLIRPEARAVWKKALDEDAWKSANAEFIETNRGSGQWQIRELIEKRWEMKWKHLSISCEIEKSKQVGIFPENAPHWDWIIKQIERSERKVSVLNLFGYSGVASLAAASEGAEITHIDSSRRAIELGKNSQTASGLADRKIRWICEDAVKFVEREIRRGNKYDALILDPPAFGLGPKKERWEFFKDFQGLCDLLADLVSNQPNFVVITAYVKDLELDMLQDGIKRIGLPSGEETYGELMLQEKSAGRRLSMSYFGQWAVG